ncbi:MAG: hypothetical protein H6Q18_98 [Bacteroidetes bacterium]|nr:hypothetical protein [Bacteroidota bacterium]
MKKLIVTFAAILIFASSVKAQSLENLFKKYADDERFEFVSVGSGLMNIASALGGVDKEAKNMMSKMKSIKILTLEENLNSHLANSFIKELDNIIANGEFETIVESREKNERTYIYKRVDAKDNADMLIVTKEPRETNVIWLKGKMSKQEMQKIMQEDD